MARRGTPAVASFPSGKDRITFNKRRKIVTARFRKFQKSIGYDYAYGVATDIFRNGVAAAIAEEAGQRVLPVIFQAKRPPNTFLGDSPSPRQRSDSNSISFSPLLFLGAGRSGAR